MMAVRLRNSNIEADQSAMSWVVSFSYRRADIADFFYVASLRDSIARRKATS
jgi:hypothetical protein